MPAYSEHELMRERRGYGVARCFRCNTPLLANLALRSEGLCTACAEGKTIQWTPMRDPSSTAPRANGPTDFFQVEASPVGRSTVPRHLITGKGRENDRANNRLWYRRIAGGALSTPCRD